MSDSVLDRIRQNRKRASVPPRNDTLIAQAQPSELDPENAALDQSLERTKPAPTKTASRNSPAAATTVSQTGSTLDELKAELAKIPETRRHSAIVLEKTLDQELTRFCKEQGITVEVFLEAAWLQVAANSELMEATLTEARRRYRDRKRAGQIRRLITMLEGQ
jgi:hypothetical protein